MPSEPHRQTAAHIEILPPEIDLDLATDGVLARRLVAFLVDLVVISALVLLFGFAILVLGLLTLGLAWLLFAILVPGVGLLYSALTVGGLNQSTVGMRLAGLRVLRAASPKKVDPLTAGVHALLFWLAASTFLLWLIDVVIGFARSDRRLGHDLLVDIVVVRADTAP